MRNNTLESTAKELVSVDKDIRVADERPTIVAARDGSYTPDRAPRRAA